MLGPFSCSPTSTWSSATRTRPSTRCAWSSGTNRKIPRPNACSTRSSPASQPAAPGPAPSSTPAGADAPETDLVGNWRATAAGTTVDLAITADSEFTWKANQSGKPPVELSGQLASTSDQIVLESKDQGSMDGTVKSLGPDKWQFALSGAPPSDPGLTFTRVK